MFCNAGYPDRKERIQAFEPNDNYPNCYKLIYDVNYVYSPAGQLLDVNDLLADSNIADFAYDDNGNRTQLKYWLTGNENEPNVVIYYEYYMTELPYNLTGILAHKPGCDPNYMFAPSDGDIDGLGRLWHSYESISIPGAANRAWSSDYSYDMLSQLTAATLNRVDTQYTDWDYGYRYSDDGNVQQKDVNSSATNYTYNGDLMTEAGNDDLTWDENGRLTQGRNQYKFYYDWDGRLKDVNDAANNRLLAFRYDALGNRVGRYSAQNGTRKYVVDISGGLPTILCEIEPGGIIMDKYIYADGQILARANSQGAYNYYVHDRLGSTRLVVDDEGSVKNSYTYTPFGEDLPGECQTSVENPFKFTGQWWDMEAGQYYLRARMYDPTLMRFTGRDPVAGKYTKPLSLHKYLYCQNDPANRIDPSGRIGFLIGGSLSFSGGEAAEFASSVMGSVGNFFGGAFGRALSSVMGLMARNTYTLQAANILGNATGGTVGYGSVFGYGKGKLFGATAVWGAAGVAKGAAYSVAFDYAVSPNAQCARDFAGGFVEVGGSKTLNGPLGPFFTGTVGATYSESINSDIYLITLSWGGTSGSGYEGHAYTGYTTIYEW